MGNGDRLLQWCLVVLCTLLALLPVQAVRGQSRSRGNASDAARSGRTRVEPGTPARAPRNGTDRKPGEASPAEPGRDERGTTRSGGRRSEPEDGSVVMTPVPDAAPEREDRVDRRRTSGTRAETQGARTRRGGTAEPRGNRAETDRTVRSRYPAAPAVRYGPPPVRIRPFPRVRPRWPWEYRYRRHWAPRFRFRQVVFVDAGWSRFRRETQVDIRTEYHYRVRNAGRNTAEVEVLIDRIEVYDRGRFVGEVDRIPDEFGRLRARINRNGDIDFDRDLFLVGDPFAGFEIISTRYYGRYILDAYDRAHGYRAGVLDFRRERIVPVRYSRLFDPYAFDGYVPIQILPDDEDWLWDYRSETFDDDAWYRTEPDPYPDRSYSSRDAAPSYERRDESEAQSGVSRRQDDASFRTERGAEIRLRREMELQRAD